MKDGGREGRKEADMEGRIERDGGRDRERWREIEMDRERKRE